MCRSRNFVCRSRNFECRSVSFGFDYFSRVPPHSFLYHVKKKRFDEYLKSLKRYLKNAPLGDKFFKNQKLVKNFCKHVGEKIFIKPEKTAEIFLLR